MRTRQVGSLSSCPEARGVRGFGEPVITCLSHKNPRATPSHPPPRHPFTHVHQAWATPGSHQTPLDPDSGGSPEPRCALWSQDPSVLRCLEPSGEQES